MLNGNVVVLRPVGLCVYIICKTNPSEMIHTIIWIKITLTESMEATLIEPRFQGNTFTAVGKNRIKPFHGKRGISGKDQKQFSATLCNSEPDESFYPKHELANTT